MIKALFFDLDNCIFNTRSMGSALLEPLLKAVENADHASVLTDDAKAGIKTDLWSLSVEDVIKKYLVPRHLAKVMRKEYLRLTAPAHSLSYWDVLFLVLLPVHYHTILVTTGIKKLQKSKIKVSRISCLFKEIIIDAVDQPTKIRGKKAIFEELLNRHGWQPQEVMVIGDNAYSELKAGKELGMVTVQILRPHVYKVDGFDHYVQDFCQLTELLKKINNSVKNP
jgi:FMN phosphatase YigB (HAD superfamily)